MELLQSLNDQELGLIYADGGWELQSIVGSNLATFISVIRAGTDITLLTRLINQINNEGAGNFGSVYYEGILTDYRWYETYGKEAGIEPRFWFGHGLSYTTFGYSGLRVARNDINGEVGYDVTFTVTNTGSVAGSEVAQVYLGQADKSLLPNGIQSAPHQLSGFYKVKDLAPGMSEIVTIHLNQRAFSFWDSTRPDNDMLTFADGTKGKWTVAKGDRTIYVGGALDDLKLSRVVNPIGEDGGFNMSTINDEFVTNAKNSSGNDISLTLMIAVYSERGVLVKFETSEVFTVEPGDLASYVFKMIKPSDYPSSYVIKAFCWDDKFAPLFREIEY